MVYLFFCSQIYAHCKYRTKHMSYQIVIYLFGCWFCYCCYCCCCYYYCCFWKRKSISLAHTQLLFVSHHGFSRRILSSDRHTKIYPQNVFIWTELLHSSFYISREFSVIPLIYSSQFFAIRFIRIKMCGPIFFFFGDSERWWCEQLALWHTKTKTKFLTLDFFFFFKVFVCVFFSVFLLFGYVL